jgi:hypothetical protein
MDLNMAKIKSTIGIVNPVARAMLQERKSPQVVPPKKGSKAKRSRKKDKYKQIIMEQE